MNTQAFEQFNVMDNEALSTVEGGGMIRCALGTAGSAGLGFVGGMGAGTVTPPSRWYSIWSGFRRLVWSSCRCCYFLLNMKNRRSLLIGSLPLLFLLFMAVKNLFKELSPIIYSINLLGLLGLLVLWFKINKNHKS